MLLARSVADYMVALNLDGTVQNQGPIERILKENFLDVASEQELHNDQLKETKVEHNEDRAALVNAGKQMVEEELAIGHVGWPVCECHSSNAVW